HARGTIYAVDFTTNNSAIAIGRTGNILRYTSNLPALKFELVAPYGDVHTLTPTFKWKTTRRDITHTLYINKSSNPFQSPLLYVIPVVYETSYTLPKEIQLTPGTYYWGIETADGTRSRPDEILRFNAWSSMEIVLVSPIGYIKDTKPKFEWHWMENVSYALYIDTDPTPFDGQFFDVGRSTTYTISNADTWKNLPEGIYSWGIVGNDDGKLTKSPIFNFVIDLSPPTGKIEINNGSKATNSPTVTLTLSATDPLANGKANGIGVVQFRLSNDGTTWTNPEDFTDTMTKPWDLRQVGGNNNDGLKTIFVQYKDALDHWSNSIKADIFLDRTPPTGTVSINNGDEVTGAFEVTLTLSASDSGVGMDGGTMMISNDSATWSDLLPYETTRRWDLSYIGGNQSDGIKTVYVQFKDPAGNWVAQSATDTIRLDRTGPKGSVTINGGSTETNSLLVTLTLSANDESGIKEMKFSNGSDLWSSPEPYNTTRENWDLSQFGGNNKDKTDKKVFVRFIDGIGNQTQPAVEDSIFFKMSVSISSLTISAPKVAGKVKNGNTVQVSAKSEPNIEITSKILVDENGNPLVPPSNGRIDQDLSGITYNSTTGLIGGSFTIGNLTAKTIQLKLIAKDKLGNQADGVSNILTVDNNPPFNISVSLLIIVGFRSSIQPTLSVNLSATDAKEIYVDGDISIVYEVDNGFRNWIPFRNLLKIRITDGDGNKVVRIKFRDEMGNESAEFTDSVV
ncbi:MAG: hypothetical protein AAB116_14890, partial [Candidatus Poribacteria bacterium]